MPIYRDEFIEAMEPALEMAFRPTRWYLRDTSEEISFEPGAINDIQRLPPVDALHMARIRYSFLTSTWRGIWGTTGQYQRSKEYTVCSHELKPNGLHFNWKCKWCGVCYQRYIKGEYESNPV